MFNTIIITILSDYDDQVGENPPSDWRVSGLSKWRRKYRVIYWLNK